MVAEVHARGIPRRELGWASTSEWFTHLAIAEDGAGGVRRDPEPPGRE